MPNQLPRWLLVAGLTLVVGSAAAALAQPAVSRKWGSKFDPHFLETRKLGAPTHVDIPAAGVSADVGPLGLTPMGYVQVPTDAHAVGWFDGSVVPGAPGASVLLGHTSRTGSAVFNRLRDLHRGDVVTVDRADAAIARFVVDRVAAFDKHHFPTLDVYGPSAFPALRLVTCAGLRDGRFTQNLVVFAHLEAPA